MTEQSSNIIAQLVFLVIITSAITHMISGSKGTNYLFRGIGRIMQGFITWTIGTLGRFAFFFFATVIDGLITIALILYHVLTVRAYMVGDDVANFLVRCNDRFFRIYVR